VCGFVRWLWWRVLLLRVRCRLWWVWVRCPLRLLPSLRLRLLCRARLPLGRVRLLLRLSLCRRWLWVGRVGVWVLRVVRRWRGRRIGRGAVRSVCVMR
jgi:hypothetical protein